MTIAWVLGSGGLLGSALCRTLRRDGTRLFSAGERFCWASAPKFAAQLEAAVPAFAAAVGVTEGWEIYWAAGIGTMGSSERDLVHETQFLTFLLGLVQSERRLRGKRGAVAFASSAGAIYAGATNDVIDESTPIAPTTGYGREKLRQEDIVRSIADHDRAILLARFSTLYGAGQSFGKQQGLIAHIARCILRNRPVQIYVPLDTIRDYIAADDAATAMITTMRATSEAPRVLTKIIASEQPTTIAEIISIFRRIARRAPRVVTSASNLTGIYSRRVQFRSVVDPECACAPGTSLFVGIAQVMATERSTFMRGPAAGT